MADYKFMPEQIEKALRVCFQGRGCKGCPIEEAGLLRPDNCRGLEIAAADAIVELAQEIAQIRAELIQRNDELLKLREKHRWIPVMQEMPPEKPSMVKGHTTSNPVLVTFICTTSPEPWPNNTVVCETMSWDGEFRHKSYSGDYKAIAWMPKPGPAKEG